MRDDAQSLCDVLDVAGIIDLTRTDASEPAPSGLQALRPAVVPGGQKPPWAMPVRAVVTPAPDAPLVVAGQADATDIDPVALLGVGDLDASERASWTEAGQPGSVVEANSVLPQLDGRTAIGVTATAVDDFISTSAFMTSTALVWVLPDDFTLAEVARDLVAFWNYRALRPQHRGTVTVLARLSSLHEEQTSRRLIDAISSTALSTPMCVFNGIAVSDDDLRDAADRLGFRVITGNTQWSERRFQRDDPVDLTAVVDHPLAGWWLEDDRFTGTSRDILAVAHRPRWQARIESPLQWHYPEALDGLVSARITSPIVTGPRTDTVAALYQQNAQWRAGGVRVFTRATRAYHLSIGMPTPAEVLAAALAGRGPGFAISDKGREIDGILAAADDLELFRSPAFHAVTEALTPHPSPRIERALQGLADQIAQNPEAASAAAELRDVTTRARAKPLTLKELANHQAVRSRQLSRVDISTVLAQMVTHGLASWGFERHCSLCGLTELVQLTAATAVPQCAGCGRDAAYTVRDGEPVLHYTLGSLLQRVSRNAGLTPLAAAAALRQDGYDIVPGATIPHGGGEREADLIGWKDYRLLVGEAKAAASLFEADHITRDLEWAAAIGATTYMITCPETLPTPLVEESIRAAEANGVELFQLTGPVLTSTRSAMPAAVQVAVEEAARRAASGPARESAPLGDDQPAPPAA